MMESIAAAGMSMSQLQFQTAYDTAMVKKSMDCMELQAQGLIEIVYRDAGVRAGPQPVRL